MVEGLPSRDAPSTSLGRPHAASPHREDGSYLRFAVSSGSDVTG